MTSRIHPLTALAGAALAIILACAVLSAAFAHDHWINTGAYRSPQDGTLCCGLSDCDRIAAEHVTITRDGYTVAGYGGVIPFHEVLRSEDGAYHRCYRPDGSVRCFFAPDQGS